MFVARVDLKLPGVFLELDGRRYHGQPVYDATRQTRVAAATGWLPGQFTWSEVLYNPNVTKRRLHALLDMAAQRKSA